ncbi:MAG: 1,2-phenylacetyl-CoA epoxidase subunit PaaD [Pseudomonadota bacterium]
MSQALEVPAVPTQGDRELIDRAWSVLGDVLDPEVPVLSVVDLGVIRRLEVGAQRITVGVAPTYSGCPAVEVIERSIKLALERAGWREVAVERLLAPPWTTEWINAQGREKLRAYGIAPPPRLTGAASMPIPCPRCHSERTERLSEFGATPCKALYRCQQCLEPFEHFKCL